MQKRTVTVGLIQMRMVEDVAENLRSALVRIEEAAKAGAQIVCLPELFLSPYFCQRKDEESVVPLAEPVPGPTTNALADAARNHQIVLIGGSIFEKTSNGPTPLVSGELRGVRKFYNTTPVFDVDGTLLGTYRKTHIPEDILYHEKRYFSPGDTGIQVFETRFGRVCPLICYDQWYPEAARIAALKGAEILFYPTAIGVIDSHVEENITGDWEQMWRNCMLGHAAANGVYLCAVNRVGREEAITFWGGSFVADPSSEVLAKAGNHEEVITATLDLDRVKVLQKAWMFLKNRRPEVYGDLAAGTRS